jgi:predicted porin
MNTLTQIAAAVGAALLTLGIANAETPNAGGSTPSPIQLYGVVDMHLQSAKGDASLNRVQSGGLSGSRFGIRGVEDLGSGLSAFFVLEGGINADDGTSGQGGATFGRQSLVGLRGAFGQFSLGRQYSSIYTATADFSAFTNGATGASTAVIGGFAGGYEPVRGASSTAVPPAAGVTGTGGPARVSNSVRFEAPAFGPVRLGMLYGAGESAGNTSDQRLYDVFVRFTGGPVDALLSHVDDSTAGINATDVATTTLAGAWTIGPARVLAGYMNVDDKRAANQDGSGYWLGGDWRIQRHLLRAQYVVNHPKTGDESDTRAIGVGYQYDLSKRTALYSSLTRFDNEANAGGGRLGRWHSSLPAGLTSASSNDLTELVAGIKHAF